MVGVGQEGGPLPILAAIADVRHTVAQRELYIVARCVACLTAVTGIVGRRYLDCTAGIEVLQLLPLVLALLLFRHLL